MNENELPTEVGSYRASIDVSIADEYKHIYELEDKSEAQTIVKQFDILKKQGGESVTVPGPVREHFIEEMADVLMYYHDILLCCGISADELRDSYIKKHETNMNRW